MLQPGRWHPLLLGPPGLLGGRLPISSYLARKGPAPPTTFPTPPRGRAIPVEVPLDRRPPPRRMVGRRPVHRASATGQGALIAPNAGEASYRRRSSAASQRTEIPLQVLGPIAGGDLMPPDEFEHLVEGNSRVLRCASDRDPTSAESIKGVVDLGFAEAPLDEPAKGLGTVRLKSLGEAIDLAKAFLRQAYGDCLGHVYNIILRIHNAFELGIRPLDPFQKSRWTGAGASGERCPPSLSTQGLRWTSKP